MFCAATLRFEPLAAASTAVKSTAGAAIPASTRSAEGSFDATASTNAFASSGFLFIFQLPAINGLRDISHTSFFLILYYLFYHNFRHNERLAQAQTLKFYNFLPK